MVENSGVQNRGLFWFSFGIAAGFTAAYFFDPSHGRQRRSKLLSQQRRLVSDCTDYGVKLGRRVKNKVFGMTMDVTSRWSNRPVSDEVLKDRIRAAFGHVIQHAKDIQSNVEDGVVRLTGSVLEDELERLVKCVRRVKGVQRVINQLEIR